MSKKSIFDIDNIVCPLCKKTHPVKRKTFDEYEFPCWVSEKTLYFKIQNRVPKVAYDWKKWCLK